MIIGQDLCIMMPHYIIIKISQMGVEDMVSNLGVNLEKSMNERYNNGVTESILELLTDLGDISSSIESIVRKEQNVAILKKWLKLAARSSSFEEFEKNS